MKRRILVRPGRSMRAAMPRKILLPLAVLILGALGLLLLSGPPGGTGGAGEAETAVPGPTPDPAGDARPTAETGGGGGSGTRVQLAPDTRTADRREEGIPSFIGRVLLPDGRPAAGATVEAWGMSGWAVMLDPRRPVLARFREECGPDGRFALPEVTRDGLRFLLRARTEELPFVELANLPVLPGRTRDLGDLRLRPGFEVRGVVSGPAGEPVRFGRVVPVPELDSAAFPVGRLQTAPALPGYEAATDAGGAFVLRRLPPGRYRLRASGPGYVEGLSAAVKAGPGETVSGIEIQLAAASVLTGFVLGPDRQGVGGAALRFEAEGLILSGESADDGGFRFDVPEGIERARLRAAADGWFPASVVLRGDELRLPVEILLQPMPPLAGYVQDEAGRAVAGAEVRLIELSRSRDPSGDPSRLSAAAATVSGGDGTFQLQPAVSRTWERRFRVVAWSEDHAPGWSETVTLAENATEPPPVVAVTLPPGRVVTGRVELPAGGPAAGARVHLRRLLASRPPGRRPAMGADSRRRSTIQRTTSAGPDGRFRFTGVAEGDYRLEAFLPGFSPAEDEDFTLLPGPPVERLLRLRAPAALEGEVVGDLDLLGRLRVTVARSGTDPLDAAVDDRGRFALPELAPGAYDVELREVDPALGAATFLFGSGRPLARLAGVEVVEGETNFVTLQVDLTDRAALRGQVTVNGEPRAGMGVFLVPRDLGAMRDPRLGWRTIARRLRSTSTDFRGEYRLAAIDPDDYWVVVQPPGRMPNAIFRGDGPDTGPPGPTGLARAEVRLGEGNERRLDFGLQLGGVRGIARVAAGDDGRLRPVPRGSRIVLEPVGRPGVAPQVVQVGRGGVFTTEELPAGDWRLSIRIRGAELRDLSVLVPAGAFAEVEPVLQPRKGGRSREDRR
ncbi:MAG: carboxypeptidase regulatory-like domain-containing protein [Planctomycetota bacterium]|nr:MAG: carboxypeptidase regulatory-like domain-containing protein [Planctomycetota bacterium]